MGKKHITFIEVLSCLSDRSLDDLIREGYSNQLVFFDCGVGVCNKQWRKAKKGDTIIYTIDGVAASQGEIILKTSRVYKPLFFPDHEEFKEFVGFAKEMCPRSFSDDDWRVEMHQKHLEAIDSKKLFFVVFAIVRTKCLFQKNKSILLDKAREMEQAEADMASVGICSLSE